MQEIWKPVVGAEDRYLVSDHGRVKSIGSMIDGRPKRERILRFNIHPEGYHLVSIRYSGAPKPTKAKVHRVMLEAFLGKSDMIVDHIDGDPSNNVLSNLRYTTQRVNMHNTRRKKEYACVKSRGPKDHRLIKYFEGRDISLGTYERAIDAHLVEVACDTLEKALIVRKFKFKRKRTKEDTLNLLKEIT